MKKYLLIITGCISLSLGIVGIFIPLLPTTPFLLLAAACFFRSSDPLYHWITHHKVFGNYILCYRQFRAVSKRTKIVSVTFLWLFIGYAALFVATSPWLRLLLLVIAVCVTAHILRLRTLTKTMLEELH